jgi:hypothetical protein
MEKISIKGTDFKEFGVYDVYKNENHEGTFFYFRAKNHNNNGANVTLVNLRTNQKITFNKNEIIGKIPVNLENAEVKCIDLEFANFEFANLKSATFIEHTNLRSAIFNNAILNNAILNNTDLTGAELINAKLIKTKLKGSDFTDANLTNADLSLTILIHAIFTGSNLTAANLTNAILYHDSLSIEQRNQYIGIPKFFQRNYIKLQRNEYNGSNVKINEKICKSYRKLYERLREATITESTKFHYIGQTGFDIGGLTKDVFDKYLREFTIEHFEYSNEIYLILKNNVDINSELFTPLHI